MEKKFALYFVEEPRPELNLHKYADKIFLTTKSLKIELFYEFAKIVTFYLVFNLQVDRAIFRDQRNL